MGSHYPHPQQLILTIYLIKESTFVSKRRYPIDFENLCLSKPLRSTLKDLKMSPAQSILACLVLLASALFAPSSAGIIPTASKSKLGVTTSICEKLDVSLPGTKLIHDACLAAGLAVGVETKATTDISVSAATDVFASAFLDVMSGCNSVAGQLKFILAGTGGLVNSTLSTLSVDVIIPTLANISAKLDAAVIAVQNLKACIDAQVAAAVYQSYATLVVTLQAVFSALVNLPVLYTNVAVKASVNATLVHIRATLDAYLNLLFTYISADLDKANLKVALFLSIDAAIKATA